MAVLNTIATRRADLRGYACRRFRRGTSFGFEGSLSSFERESEKNSTLTLTRVHGTISELYLVVTTRSTIDAWILSSANVIKLIGVVTFVKSLIKGDRALPGDIFASDKANIHMDMYIESLTSLLSSLRNRTMVESHELSLLLDRGFEAIQYEGNIYLRDALSIFYPCLPCFDSPESCWIHGSYSCVLETPNEQYDILFIPTRSILYRGDRRRDNGADSDISNNGSWYTDFEVAFMYVHDMDAVVRAYSAVDIKAWKVTRKNVERLKRCVERETSVKAGPFTLSKEEALGVIEAYANTSLRDPEHPERLYITPQNTSKIADVEHLEAKYGSPSAAGQYYTARLFMRLVCSRGFKAVVTTKASNIRRRDGVFFHPEIFLSNPNVVLRIPKWTLTSKLKTVSQSLKEYNDQPKGDYDGDFLREMSTFLRSLE